MKTKVRIPTLCLLQCRDVLHVLGRQALDELIHLELIRHARLFAVARSRDQIAAISIEQASEAPHKRRSYLIRAKSRWAHDADRVYASTVSIRAAA